MSVDTLTPLPESQFEYPAGDAPRVPRRSRHGEAPDALPPVIELPRQLQTLRFSIRQIEFVFRARRRAGRGLPHATG